MGVFLASRVAGASRNILAWVSHWPARLRVPFRNPDHERWLTERQYRRLAVFGMIKRRARQARLLCQICCCTFRPIGGARHLVIELADAG
jgi:hypothetical protein